MVVHPAEGLSNAKSYSSSYYLFYNLEVMVSHINDVLKCFFSIVEGGGTPPCLVDYCLGI